MQNVIFASAYRQLTPHERVFVDGVVRQLEESAERTNDRISNALYKPIPQQIVDRSNGLLERPMVTAAISERINEIAASQELTVQRVVKELMSIAFANIGNYMKIDEITGEPVFDLTTCTPEQLAAVKQIDVEEVGDGVVRPLKRKVKVVLHDKIAGMKMLGEYLGMLTAENPYVNAEMSRINALRSQQDTGGKTSNAGDEYAAMIGA